MPSLQSLPSGRRPARLICLMLAARGGLAPVHAMCVKAPEEGVWWNTDAHGDLASLDIAMGSCGDQVLNGVATKTTFKLTAAARQSNGDLHHRPPVEAVHKKAKDGKTWLYAEVPTGGYVDQISVRRRDGKGQERLYVYIRHKSLDSKPDAESRLWFTHRRPIAKPVIAGERLKQHPVISP